MKKPKWITMLHIAAFVLAGCEQKSLGQSRQESAAVPAGKQAPSSQPGAKMDSTADSAQPAHSSPRQIGFQVGEHGIVILKIADAKTVPAGKFLGKEELAEKARRFHGQGYLVHILIPSAAKGMRLSVETGGKPVALAPPSLVYRMPNSPLRTYAILEGSSAARLLGIAADGSKGSLDLGPGLERLREMAFYWTASDSGHLDYDDLPSSLYGSMGH